MLVTAYVHNAYCPLTKARRVNYPITLSNYKHDAYPVLLELKSSFYYDENSEAEILNMNPQKFLTNLLFLQLDLKVLFQLRQFVPH